MKHISNLTACLAALAFLASTPAIATQERSPDGQAIDQLARAGSDLTRLHQVDFLLRFPTQKAAERAELQLIGLAFITKIEPGKTAEERVIHASKKLYPVESDLSGLRDKLNAVATTEHGTYEGWQAKPVAAAK